MIQSFFLLLLPILPLPESPPAKKEPLSTSHTSSSRLLLKAHRYGKSSFSKRLIDSTKKSGRTAFDWLFWYAQWGENKILIDSGFTDEKYIKRYAMKDYQSPTQLLAKDGISPNEITDVIITHSHFDHIGGAHLFPNANIWIQRTEYKSFTRTSRYRSVKAFFDKAKTDGRLQLLDGDKEILPGVEVRLTGGHTVGHQVVLIHDVITHVFVGDECYQDKLCRNRISLPAASCYNMKRNRIFLKSLAELYKSGAQIHSLHQLE